MLIYKRIQQIRNLDDTLVFHLRQTLVHLQQIFSGGFLLRLEGTDFINKAFYFGFRIIIGNADLAKHDRAKVLVPYHDRHGHIYDTAMAQIDIGLLQTHCLKPGQGVTAVAAFAETGFSRITLQKSVRQLCLVMGLPLKSMVIMAVPVSLAIWSEQSPRGCQYCFKSNSRLAMLSSSQQIPVLRMPASRIPALYIYGM